MVDRHGLRIICLACVFQVSVRRVANASAAFGRGLTVADSGTRSLPRREFASGNDHLLSVYDLERRLSSPLIAPQHTNPCVASREGLDQLMKRRSSKGVSRQA